MQGKMVKGPQRGFRFPLHVSHPLRGTAAISIHSIESGCHGGGVPEVRPPTTIILDDRKNTPLVFSKGACTF